MNFFEKLENLPRFYKSAILLLNDIFLIPFSLYLSCYLITGGYGLSNSIPWTVYLSLSVVTSVIFLKFGMYRAIVRYLGLKTMWTIGGAASVATIWLMVTAKLLYSGTVPLRVYAIFWLLSTLCLGGSRFIARQIFSSLATVRLRSDIGCNRKRVAIYGAGSTGVRLARYISSASEFIHTIYFDDDKKLFGREIDGVEVFPSSELKRLCKERAIDEVFLAIPNADESKRKMVLEALLECGVRVKTVPGFAGIVSGEVRVEELREISVDDILGRDTVSPRKELLNGCIEGKTVMVTGAGGSIGSELCRQIVMLGPKKLVLFELSEFALYKVESELKAMMVKEYSIEIEIIALLGSVQHKKRLAQVMQAYDVQTVYHAAAYKHVPIVEHNPIEGVRNNIFGTLNAVLAAEEANVETFVLVSTDKAVRPKNVMGATKRFAELVLQGISHNETKTKFCMVRFGNVLNSSGSVVPLFKKQIENKESLTVTHPEVIRYFMTIPEAAQLVLQAGYIAKGGDVCVLDMGEPVKIIDLARKMIALSGLKEKTETSEGDIEIKIVGLRPGEKLYEELLIGDNVSGTEHPLIMRAEEMSIPWAKLQGIINDLDNCCHESDVKGVRDILLDVVSGYEPQCDIQDKVWLENNVKNLRREKVIPFGASSSV